MCPRVHRSSFRYGVLSVLRDQNRTAEMPGCCAIHAANNTFRLLPIITDCSSSSATHVFFFFPFNVVVAVAYFNNGAKVALSLSSLLSRRIGDNTTPRTEHRLILLGWSSIRMYSSFVSRLECKNVHFSNIKSVYVSIVVLCVS